MNKYKIEIKQSETFIVDVEANNEEESKTKASEKWNNGDYQETGDIETDFGTIYDITNTDDPFNP